MNRRREGKKYSRAERQLRAQARTLAEFVARSRLVRELGGRPSGHPQRGRPVPWDRLIAESGLERAPFTPDRG